jgi:hypothetical protein
MTGKHTSVYGIYKTRTAAENGVDRLIGAGFSAGDISALLSQAVSSREFAHEKHTKAPEGGTTGAVAGGAVGGTLGLLAGIGAIAIPGIGPFIAAGPIMTALAGAGAGGAVGTLIGALSGLGMPEYEAKRYEGRVKTGDVLVSIHCDTSDEITLAKDLLKSTGAEDIASAGEAKGRDHRDDPSSRGSSWDATR